MLIKWKGERSGTGVKIKRLWLTKGQVNKGKGMESQKLIKKWGTRSRF